MTKNPITLTAKYVEYFPIKKYSDGWNIAHINPNTNFNDIEDLDAWLSENIILDATDNSST